MASRLDDRIFIFMPAYNAGRLLQRTYNRIPESCIEAARGILIVNDGSTDDTETIATCIARHDSRVRVITFGRNLGYGCAVRAALLEARAMDVDAAVCLHADGQYAPEEMPALLAARRRRRLDILQGSRHASRTALAGGMPLYKWVGGQILSLMESIVFRMRMSDYHSGYLCYSRRALGLLPFDRFSNSFDFDLEAIAAARAFGLRIGEEPIPTHYGEEDSHLSPVAYGLRVLRIMVRSAQGHYSALSSRHLRAAVSSASAFGGILEDKPMPRGAGV